MSYIIIRILISECYVVIGQGSPKLLLLLKCSTTNFNEDNVILLQNGHHMWAGG